MAKQKANSSLNTNFPADSRAYHVKRKADFEKKYPEVLSLDLCVPPTEPASLVGVNLQAKLVAQIAVTVGPMVLSGICGAIMGDGSIAIHSNYTNARYQSRQSSRQEDWFWWKAIVLFGSYTSKNAFYFAKPDGFQENAVIFPGEILGKYRIQTGCYPDLTNIHNFITVSRVKTFQRSWLNHMNNYFLMVLWLDDGSITEQDQGVFSLNSSTQAELKVLSQYLEVVWGVKTLVKEQGSRASSTNPQPWALVIADLSNLEKFINIIAPVVPVKSLLYKLCLYQNNSAELQRWTSNLKTLVRPAWHGDIDDIYAANKYLRENPPDPSLIHINSGPYHRRWGTDFLATKPWLP